MNQTTQSDKLVQELIEIKAITPEANLEMVKLVIRKYLCDTYAEGVIDTNHKNYIETKKK